MKVSLCILDAYLQNCMKQFFLVNKNQFQFIKIMIHLNPAVNPFGKATNPEIAEIISPLKFAIRLGIFMLDFLKAGHTCSVIFL